jgi:hypothetical protein
MSQSDGAAHNNIHDVDVSPDLADPDLKHIGVLLVLLGPGANCCLRSQSLSWAKPRITQLRPRGLFTHLNPSSNAQRDRPRLRGRLFRSE